jgi:LEA14-like dessication related protein
MTFSIHHLSVVLRLIPLIAIGCTVSSCSTLPSANPGLDINLADIRFDSSTAFETTANVTLRLSNESPDPIKIRGAVHEVTMNDVQLGKILTGETFEIPPFSEHLQETSMKVSHLRVITRLRRLAQARVFDYQLKSQVHLIEPRMKIRLKKSETLDLRQAP